MKASRNVVTGCALTVASALTAILALTGAAGAQETTTLTSPRWAYEIRGGEFKPDLERFADFYGDPDDGYFSLGVSYRFRDWLELGGEIGQMRDTGIGVLQHARAGRLRRVPAAARAHLYQLHLSTRPAAAVRPAPRLATVARTGVLSSCSRCRA